MTDEAPADDAQPAQEEVTDGETSNADEVTDETPADGTETEETTDEEATDEETKSPEFDKVEKKINQQLPDEDPDEEWEKIKNEYLKNKKYNDIVK